MHVGSVPCLPVAEEDSAPFPSLWRTFLAFMLQLVVRDGFERAGG